MKKNERIYRFEYFPPEDHDYDYSQMSLEEKIVFEMILRLKKLRQVYKMTQIKLSRRSGVSYASIRHFERTGNISFRSFLKIVNAIDNVERFDSVLKEGHHFSSLPELYFKKRRKSEADLEFLDL